MQRNPTILIVGTDPRLETEVACALQGIAQVSPVLYYVADPRQAVEAARSRQPDFALVEMGKDLRALKNFADEVTLASRETNVAAVFSSDLFGPDVSESAFLIQAMRAGMQDFLRRP